VVTAPNAYAGAVGPDCWTPVKSVHSAVAKTLNSSGGEASCVRTSSLDASRFDRSLGVTALKYTDAVLAGPGPVLVAGWFDAPMSLDNVQKPHKKPPPKAVPEPAVPVLLLAALCGTIGLFRLKLLARIR
jgi:hypothetical protein